jgi:hypothetical protein
MSRGHSNPFNAATSVLLSAGETCSIAWTMPGASVNAATSGNFRLPADAPRLFGVAPGMIVSVIS